MADISTLVGDIHDLFRKPHKVETQRVDEFGRELAEILTRRLGEERGQSYLRMSNLGKGDRQLWYEIRHPELSREELSPSTKIKFLYGDILESLLLFLAAEAGHDVQNRQTTVDVEGVTGSIDGTIDGVLVDVKSASSQGFRKFTLHNVPEDDSFGYMEQLSGYSEGMGKVDAAFLAIDKVTGNLALDQHSAEDLAAYRIRDRAVHAKEVVASEEIPERCHLPKPYGKSGNMVLGTNCSYCPFKRECWKDVNGGIGLRTFLYSSGPVHFVEVIKEPEVHEVTF